MATQITATLPTLDFPREVDYPTQEDWAAFSSAAEENFGILGGDWSTQMQLWKNQANAMSIESNNNADIAQAVANYQGDWVSQGYTLGQTVSVSGIYYICKLTHASGQNPTDVSSLYWNLALGNWSLKVDTNMSGYASKSTPVDADLIPLSDSSTSFGIKKLTWANLKVTLQTYFDTLYATTTYVDGKMVLGTAVNASGTAIDFTGIPSWVKKITIIFNGLSASGTSNILVKIGSGSISSSGYICNSSYGTVTSTINTAGFTVSSNQVATNNYSGIINLILSDIDTWTESGLINSTSLGTISGGYKILSDTLDRIRITTVNGTDQFDAGKINILYEG